MAAVKKQCAEGDTYTNYMNILTKRRNQPPFLDFDIFNYYAELSCLLKAYLTSLTLLPIFMFTP